MRSVDRRTGSMSMMIIHQSAVSPRPPRKKSLKRALVSKMKLDLAKARTREEAEAARLAYEHRQKMELRRLEEEATLAELEWKIETQYDENAQVPGVVSPTLAPTFLVDKQPHSTPFISLPTDGSEENSTTVQPAPGVVIPIEASTCLADKKLDSTPLNSISVSVPDEQPNKQTDTKGALHNETTATGTPGSGTSKAQDSVTTQSDPPERQPDTSNPISEMCPPQLPRPPCVMSLQSAVGDDLTPLHHIPYQGPIPSEVHITAASDTVKVPDCMASHEDPLPWERNMSSFVKGTHWPQASQSLRVAPSRCTSGEDRAPHDPIAAMCKVQLLSGIKPKQVSGNPADFPFFQQQIQTHLESDLLTDAQRVEYLPKFVTVPEDMKRELFGCQYALGWCVSGPYDVKRRQGIAANFVSLSQTPDYFIQRFWNLEDYGAVKSGEKSLSVEDKTALKIIEDTARLIDGHYEVGLVWKMMRQGFQTILPWLTNGQSP